MTLVLLLIALFANVANILTFLWLIVFGSKPLRQVLPKRQPGSSGRTKPANTIKRIFILLSANLALTVCFTGLATYLVLQPKGSGATVSPTTTPTVITTFTTTPSLSPTTSTPALTSTAIPGGTPLVAVDMDLFHHLIEQNGVPNGVSDSTSYIRDLHQGEIAYTSGESFDAKLEFQTVMNLNGTNTKVSEPSSADDRNGTTTIVYIFIGAGHIEVTNFTTQNWGNGYGLIRQGVNPLAQALVLAENIQQHFSQPGSGAQGNPSKHVYYAIIDAGSKKILATTIPNLTQFVA